MPFADWDFFASGGAATQALELVTPIVGVGSLESLHASASTFNGTLDGGFSRGFTKGRVRTLLHHEASSTPAAQHPGVYCMSDVQDATNIAGDWYALVVDGGTTGNLRLLKGTGLTLNGISTATVLGTPTNVPYALGQTISIQLEWNLNVDGLGGMLLKASTGTALNFSDLAEVQVFFESTPHTVANYEGIFCRCDGSGEHFFDDTSIFSGA